jgi:hypothetical protein
MSADSGPGTREVAYRLFAAEFEDSTVSYSESDEERAPNYVITPTGGRVNRVFLAGVLTETERVGGEQIRGRIVDPTGAFVAYAGQYQPDELAFLDRVDPPAFLAVTGKARTFSPEDSDRVYTSVRPESISEVDAETRDRWVVRTAEQTLDRVATMASALRSDLRGEALRDRIVDEGVDAGLASGVALAIEHYDTTSAYLQALRGTALDAVRVVAGERDEVDRLDLAPDEGGTEDAGLAGLATMDLGTTAPAPGVAADEPASTATPGAGTDTAPDEPTGSAASGETDSGPAESTTDTTTDTEPGATTEPEPEPEKTAATTTAEAEPSGTAETVEAGSTDAGTDTDVAESTTPTDEPEAVGTDEGAEPGPTGAAEPDEPAADAEEDFEDFEPGEFELPEEEREEIEAEFGTDFETAGEVDPAGEAGIETPESEEPTAGTGDAAASTPETEPATEPETTEESGPTEESGTEAGADTDAEAGAEAEVDTDVEADAEAGSEPEPEPEPEPTAEPDDATATEEADVGEVTVEVIAELDDGDGADREAVVETVAERHGVDPEAVADAIEDAMMSGRAYEPSDGRLKAI